MSANSSHPNWHVEQQRRNRQSQDAWMAFDGHRQRVTQLLIDAAARREQPTLTLLGAGNCNDVDLPALLAAYSAVRLVDIDAEALEAGVARQGLVDSPAIVRLGNVDLAARSELPAIVVDPPADVAASLCVLSQILEVAIQQAGAEESAILAAVLQARRIHVEALLNCLRPGGTGLIVTDFVSSESAPELTAADDSHLPAFAAHCLATGNFFTGLNPATLLRQFSSEASLRDLIEGADVYPPWKWHFGPRTYLVYGLRFHRALKS